MDGDFFSYKYPVLLAPFDDQTVLSPTQLLGWVSLSKINRHINVVYF